MTTRSYAVVGLGYGDEGKGVVTEYLCSRDPGNTAVVRFSGGHQCGHKVVKDDVEHVFANFGSGTLSGCPTHWTEHCTFDPVGFWNEYCLLLEKGANPRIQIDSRCPVVTVFDVAANRNSEEMEHGTTGMGFFRTKKRHFQDDVKLTVEDCLRGSWDKLMQRLDGISEYYNLEDRVDIGDFVVACYNIRRLLGGDCVRITPQLLLRQNLVFEGSQGLLLDENIGDFPHVTPSDVTPRNILDTWGKLDEVYLVSRVYQTRHGNGPMINEDCPVKLVNTEKETNHHNKYQGEFRVCALDLGRLQYARTAGITKVVHPSTRVNLVMTCADQVDEYKVMVGRDVRVFSDVDEFVRFIGHELTIDGDLYVNTSPLSTTVRRVKEEEG